MLAAFLTLYLIQNGWPVHHLNHHYHSCLGLLSRCLFLPCAFSLCLLLLPLHNTTNGVVLESLPPPSSNFADKGTPLWGHIHTTSTLVGTTESFYKRNTSTMRLDWVVKWDARCVNRCVLFFTMPSCKSGFMFMYSTQNDRYTTFLRVPSLPIVCPGIVGTRGQPSLTIYRGITTSSLPLGHRESLW